MILKHMKIIHKTLFCAAIIAAAAVPLAAQTSLNNAVSNVNTTYADIADLVTEAPIAVDLQIRKVRKLPASQSFGVPENIARVLVEADVVTLLRGPGGVAARQRFLVDLPKDARGKIPNLKKQRFFAFASPVAGRSDMLQLIRPDALLPYNAQTNGTVRSIVEEVVKPAAPAKITGVSSAFYSPGTILGEGETQIFLTTATGDPFGISVVSRGDIQRSWTVSTSEVISDAVPAPQRGTLLWYRLACGLPRQMPADVTGPADSGNAARVVADYSFVRAQLGQCNRTRPLPG